MRRLGLFGALLAAGFLATLVTGPLQAAEQRLYLTDGTYHIVREYEVLSDRVRFYSTERREWEEIPLSLIDLDRTKSEEAAKEAEQASEQEFWDREEAADRAMRQEAAMIPNDPGVYMVENGELRTFPRPEMEIVNDKGRSLLRAIAPVPIVAGKRVVWVTGITSPNAVHSAQPYFYMRLDQEERFGIIQLTPDKKKEMRKVEERAIMPVTDQIIEEHESIEVFRRQISRRLYQVWPKEPLQPGEYAVIEFSPGEANAQVWDFKYEPAP